MKPKSRENELIFERKSDEIRFHVLMEIRHRSDGRLTPITWKENNRFLVHEGPDAGEFFGYRSCRFTESDASDDLRERGYVNFLAAGSIDWVGSVLRFERPDNTMFCAQLLRRITVDDSRLVEYYKGFGIIAPNGDSLEKMESYWSPQ